jgi:hypothetical protein
MPTIRPTSRERKVGNRPTLILTLIVGALVLSSMLGLHVILAVDNGDALSRFLPLISAPSTGGKVYYVSKTGNNADGRSWSTAWNELDQIGWNVVRPGDTILLDGGSSEMTYTTTLTIGKSGTSDNSITIKLADEIGRNGRVVLFGGRTTPLPYCGQQDYTYDTDGVRTDGIVIGAYSWIVIDGVKRSGLVIYGHNGHGIQFLTRAANNISLRNSEIYDNGIAYQNDGRWYPDQKGIQLAGTNLNLERLILHDNGQDSIQGDEYGIGNVTIRTSWFYDRRPDPTRVGYSFNECGHNDGIQVWGGGAQSGLLIEDSVFGPYEQQGVIVGDKGLNTTIDDVTIRNSLFINATNNNIYHELGQTSKPRGWHIENVTSYMTPSGPGGEGHCGIEIDGTDHSLTNSIFQGGCNYLPNWEGPASGNCYWDTEDPIPGGQYVDPQFVGPLPITNAPTFDQLANADFSLKPTSACYGKGSHITSVQSLLSEIDRLNLLDYSAPTPSATVAQEPSPTSSPTPETFAWEAEASALTGFVKGTDQNGVTYVRQRGGLYLHCPDTR